MTHTAEIGDTWVHGSASDPLRIADYRAVLRARASCVRDPACDSQVRRWQIRFLNSMLYRILFQHYCRAVLRVRAACVGDPTCDGKVC